MLRLESFELPHVVHVQEHVLRNGNLVFQHLVWLLWLNVPRGLLLCVLHSHPDNILSLVPHVV